MTVVYPLPKVDCIPVRDIMIHKSTIDHEQQRIVICSENSTAQWKKKEKVIA